MDVSIYELDLEPLFNSAEEDIFILRVKYSIILVWLYILDYENQQNPREMVKREINKWEEISQCSVQESTMLLEKARSFIQFGIEVK